MKNFRSSRDDILVCGELRPKENDSCFCRNEKEIVEQLQVNCKLVKGQLGFIVDHNNLRFAFPFGKKSTYQEEESKKVFTDVISKSTS